MQAAAGDLDKANISVAEACALLDYDKAEVMPINSLMYKIDKWDKVSSAGSAALHPSIAHGLGSYYRKRTAYSS